MSSFLAKATEWLDDHALLREAVTRTARDTGFASSFEPVGDLAARTRVVMESDFEGLGGRGGA
jgi:hypothetical protein